MATFRRNKSGEWVVQGTPAEVVVGKVRVDRKDNTTRVVNVLSVGKPFKAFDGTMKVYGYLTVENEETAQAAPEPTPAPATVPVQAEFSYDPCGAPEDCEF